MSDRYEEIKNTALAGGWINSEQVLELLGELERLRDLLQRAHQERINRESGSYGKLCDEIDEALGLRPQEEVQDAEQE